MPIPFNYTEEQVFYLPDNFNESDFLQKLLKKANIIKPKNNYTDYNFFILNLIRIRININILIDNVNLRIRYSIKTFELNIIMLFALLFFAFFLGFSKKNEAIISITAGIIIYINCIVYIVNKLKTSIDAILDQKPNQGDFELWQKQKKWLNTPGLCPACGEPVNPYSTKCVVCGLTIGKNKKKASNQSATTNTDIIFTIKKNKNA